ncbi:DUF5659 domain-containing protein [Clostridium tertium]|uniref:DUF5659 domain-containing protein n=1 Tax=Clostridium tertium TaxID=1559 RepID=UPI000DD03AFC|nr:DUF5659 domain-containing protein [Clostridium tertium]
MASYRTSSNSLASFLKYFGYGFKLNSYEDGKVYFLFDENEKGFHDTVMDFKDAVNDRRSVYIDYARLLHIQEDIREMIKIYKENK